MKVAVVGGGIAGLSAAWELRGRADVTVYEGDRLGGKILTTDFEGRPVDCGADAFITRVPDGLQLCAEIGLDDLVTPAAGRTLIWWRERARLLPEGLVLGVPRELGPLIPSGLLGSGLLGPLGLLRAGADLVLPATTPATDDLSVGELVSRRFGRQVADRLVDPLVGGIHAGRIDDLSAEATVPQLLQAGRRSRSLLLGLRRAPAAPAGGGSIFAAPRGGMRVLVDRLVERLSAHGVGFSMARVRSITPDGDAWRVGDAGDLADAVILAVASDEGARIVGPAAPAGLATIRRASVALVTLGYPAFQLPSATNGILVPRASGMLMTACSYASSKWPGWAGPGRVVLRVSAGRWGDGRAMDLDDDQLMSRLSDELATVVGVRVAPTAGRVSRWPASFPQYRPGHKGLVDGIRAELHRQVPGVELCGSSYDGSGIPACIASGRAAARRTMARVADRA